MIFGAPEWFWAFAFLPILLGLFVWNQRRSAQLIAQVVAPRLRQQLAGNVSPARRGFRFFLLLLGLACLIVSLAQPRFGFTWEQSKRKGRDVILAVDTSRSMLATDLPPNRLARVKLAAQDLIGLLGGDRVGLVAFAGTAFLQAPLTVDYGSVLSSLRELDTNIIPRGGTNIEAAIRTAAEAFGKGESDNRCLIIFTDGEELDADGVEAARKLSNECRIFTVGAGTAEGSIIPIPAKNGGTEFVKDSAGRIVKSRMDEARLTEIAEVAGGFYLPLQSGAAEMRQLFEQGISPMRENEIDARTSRRPIERYQWPLGAAVLLLLSSLLVSDRKRPGRVSSVPGPKRETALAAVVLLLSLSTGQAARNNAVELYQGKDYEGSYKEFKKQLGRNQRSEALHFGLGAAAYQKGNYDEALQEFSTALRSEDSQLRALAEYNLGNTLYQQALRRPAKEPQLKSLKNALQHYDEALKIKAGDENARFNRDLVEEMIRKLEQEPPKQEKSEKKDDSSEEKKDENKDQQQQQEEKKQDQKQKEQQDKDQQGQSNEAKEPENNGKPDGSEPKPEEQKAGGDEKKDDPKKPQKGDDKKEGQNDQNSKDREQQSPGQAADQSGKDPDERRENAARNAPTQPDRKLDGNVEAQPSSPDENASAELQPDEAREDGQMSELQARALIESMKGEDDRVPLIERKGSASVLKDW